MCPRDLATRSIALEPAQRTLNHLLEKQATAHGSTPLLEINGRSFTIEETRSLAARRAGALRTAGIAPGDRVAVFAENSLEVVELFLGCAWNGSVFVPINIAARGAQLDYILNDVAPKALVGTSPLVTLVSRLSSRPPSLERIWCLGEREPLAAGIDPLSVLADEVGPYDADPGDTLAILYTSGTTGPSKGVCCPHAQFYWWGVNTAAALGVGPDDVLSTCLPLFHTNALNTLVQALLHGARFVLAPRFSASRFWQRLADSEATVTYLLGAMASILVNQQPCETDQAHCVRVALAPGTSPQVWDLFEERFGVRLVEGHGMTETNLAIGPRDNHQRPGWMGRVMSEFEGRVVDEHDADVPDGTPGELVLRASEPFAFSTGYYRRPEETVRAWQNLWFHTGDRVVRDADGFFRFVDRIKDSIRRRGENISAWEVEQVVLAHSGVDAAAAIPVPSELGEDEVMVFVVPRDGFADPADLLRYCEPRLAHYALPRYVEFVDSLPLTENGKVHKAELRWRGVSDATWDREHAGYEVRRE